MQSAFFDYLKFPSPLFVEKKFSIQKELILIIILQGKRKRQKIFQQSTLKIMQYKYLLLARFVCFMFVRLF